METLLLQKLAEQLTLDTMVEHDHEVRSAYLQKTLRFLHLIKKADILTVEEYTYLYKLRNKINDIWRNYLKGRMNTASSQMQNMLQCSFHHQTYDMMFDRIQQLPNVLYRGRVSLMPLLDCQEFYHIPFTKRYLIQNQRYSITGIPCLYLAGSLPCMYKELGKTNISYGEFRPLKAFSLLDVSVSYPQMEKRRYSHEQLFAFLCTMPLKYALSIWAKDNEKHAFKSNYVISQLLTAAVYNRKIDIKGICYASGKAKELPYEQRLNYVFLPTFQNLGQAYDEELMHSFQITVVKKEKQKV